MSTLPEIAAVLTGPLVDPGGARNPQAVKDHVNRYFDILRELEEQARERRQPSMNEILYKLPRNGGF